MKRYSCGAGDGMFKNENGNWVEYNELESLQNHVNDLESIRKLYHEAKDELLEVSEQVDELKEELKEIYDHDNLLGIQLEDKNITIKELETLVKDLKEILNQ